MSISQRVLGLHAPGSRWVEKMPCVATSDTRWAGQHSLQSELGSESSWQVTGVRPVVSMVMCASQFLSIFPPQERLFIWEALIAMFESKTSKAVQQSFAMCVCVAFKLNVWIEFFSLYVFVFWLTSFISGEKSNAMRGFKSIGSCFACCSWLCPQMRLLHVSRYGPRDGGGMEGSNGINSYMVLWASQMLQMSCLGFLCMPVTPSEISIWIYIYILICLFL